MDRVHGVWIGQRAHVHGGPGGGADNSRGGASPARGRLGSPMMAGEDEAELEAGSLEHERRWRTAAARAWCESKGEHERAQERREEVREKLGVVLSLL
jgi:hypothetical protein